MISSEIKYYLRPIGPLHYEEGRYLSRDKDALLIQGIYFSKIEVISRQNSLKKRKVYDFKDFFRILDKNKAIRDVFNNLKYKNKIQEKTKLKNKDYSIFGILNVTPDSFSDGGKNIDLSKAIDNALKMINEGASFIDIGGESTRPGAEEINADEEISRVLPIIQRLNFKKVDLSLDTRNSSTMEFGILSGVKVINDVSGLIHDKNSINVIKRYNIPVVIMHMPGTPKTMMKNNKYSDVVLDVFDFLDERKKVLVNAGIKHENIIIDPGIGFGKDYLQNLELIKNLSTFHSLGVPLMLGVSRKRFIEAISSESEPKERVGGTISATLSAMTQGIKIHRVHDVKEINQALKVFERLLIS